MLAPLAGALGRLHAAGVVHGDVSPGNVLLDLDGRPVLADLGVGRVVGDAPAPVWGTPGHIAPEVLIGRRPVAGGRRLRARGARLAVPGRRGARGSRAAARPWPRSPSPARGPRALVAAVEAAVRPAADERPGADELAVLLFAAAAAEPLHLVVGDDDVSAVTYRLRAAAGRPPAQRVAPAGATAPGAPAARRPRPRVRAAAPTRAGVLAAPARVRGAARRGASPSGVARRARPRPRCPTTRPGRPARSARRRARRVGAGRGRHPGAGARRPAHRPPGPAHRRDRPPRRARRRAGPRLPGGRPRPARGLGVGRRRALRPRSGGGRGAARERAALRGPRVRRRGGRGGHGRGTRAVLRARLGVAPLPRRRGRSRRCRSPGRPLAPVLVDLVRGREGWRVTALRDG